MEFVFTVLGAFLIGSIPFAYIVMRVRYGIDIRSQGSGNVGAMNAFEVSRSQRIGWVIFALDFCKGLLPIAALHALGWDSFGLAGGVLVATVVGHNYTPWLGFRGGRGLASAAGGFLLLNPLPLILWIVFWIAAWFKTRSIHFGNIAATVLIPFGIFFLPDLAKWFSLFPYESHWQIVIVTVCLSVVIFLRHIEPLKQIIEYGIVRDSSSSSS